MSTLTELGLAEQEISVYLTLLKIGGSTASITAKAAGIKRTTVYAILHSLAQKGFVTMYYRKGRQLYYAEKPERIKNYFEKRLENFEALIPTLEALEKTRLQVSGLRFIETIDELKKFYADILNEYKNKEYYAIGSAGAWEGLNPEFFVQYRKDRAKANIKTRILLSNYKPEASPDDANLLRKVKFLPEKYAFKSTIDIFNDKILIISSDLTSLAVVIQIPAMTDIFKAMFEMLWENSP